MSIEDDKSLLDDYLADDPAKSDGLSEPARQYRGLPAAEPSKRMDRAILAEAREAVRKDAADRSGSFWSNWLKPLTAAAAMGVCLVLVLQLMQSNQRQLEIQQAPIGVLDDRGLAKEMAETQEEPAIAIAPERDQDQPGSLPSVLVSEPPPSRTRLEREDLFADAAVGASGNLAAESDIGELSLEMEALTTDGNEIVVTARKREEALQDVPVSIAASRAAPAASPGFAAGGEADVATEKAADAFRVDEEVLYPARDVWQAGIDAVSAKGDRAQGLAEQKKLQQVYPEAAPADAVVERSLPTGADTVSQPRVIDPAAAAVWLAGIDYLLGKGEQARAEEELLRFQTVYPTHPAVTGGVGEDY